MNQISGTRTRSPEQCELMADTIQLLRNLMRNRGVDERDYPILERTKFLMKKYGDDEKLIYNISPPTDCKRDIEPLSLRYDLTTQFMLYAPQGKSNTFQVGKVFRRETSSRNQKRLREFYQFDYDMKGYPERFSVFECLDTLIDCLDVIGIGRDMYDVKINDRRIVNKLLENAKVPEELRKTTCSTIDKLDKYRSWELVTKELKEKGVEDPDKVRAEFCKNIQQRTRSKDGYWMEPAYFDTIPNLSYSSTLVRGLDYYTGVVFEVVLKDTRMSIAAGGQYNDSIGFSIGLDRIQDLIPPLSEYQRKTWYLITFGGIEVEIAALKRAREMRQDYYRVKIYPIKKASKIKNAIAKINKDSGLFEVLGPDDI